jgi:hypothetical protein
VTTTPVAVYLPDTARWIRVAVSARMLVSFGDTYAIPAVTSVNGISTISSAGVPTGGTFKLSVFPNTNDTFETTALPYNETAANVKTALIAGSTRFVTGDITAAGGPLPTAITLTWTGVYAGTVPPLLVTSPALTGGTNPKIKVSTTTQPKGGGGYGYAEAAAMNEYVLARDVRAGGDYYLYIAAATGTADYFVTAYA